MSILYKKGFTILELLMVISLLVLISLFSFPKLSDFKKAQSLKNTTEIVMTVLNKAKSDSLSSLNSSNYGVHFDNDKAVYFVGDTYSINSSTNQVFDFEPGIIIPDTGGINLGGGSEVIFPRLTGNTIGYGTIVIQIESDPSHERIITIKETGAINSN